MGHVAWTSFLVGGLLIVAPLVLGFSKELAPLFTDMIAGIILVAAGGAALLRRVPEEGPPPPGVRHL